MRSFDFQDEVFNALADDEIVLNLLGDPATDVELNKKIQREIAPLEIVKAERLPFISIYFIGSVETGNYVFNKGYMTIDYYTPTRVMAQKLSKRISDIMLEKFRLTSSSEYTENSGVQGVFFYTQKFKPLIWA